MSKDGQDSAIKPHTHTKVAYGSLRAELDLRPAWHLTPVANNLGSQLHYGIPNSQLVLPEYRITKMVEFITESKAKSKILITPVTLLT